MASGSSTTEVSAVTRMYDLTLWLLPHTAQFSRAHRFTLGERIEEGALETLELLVEATYAQDKRDLLRRANRRLERLRYLVRLAKDLQLVSLKQYEFAARGLESVGKEVGGWARQQKALAGQRPLPLPSAGNLPEPKSAVEAPAAA